MASFIQLGWRELQGLGVVLLCLLGLPRAGAQPIEGQRQLPELGAKEATRLLLYQVAPEYPILAKVNYIQGKVRAQIEVSPDGTVVSAHVLSGEALLAAAVLGAVQVWRYRPFVTAGGPTSFVTKIDVNFMLRGRKMDLVPQQAEWDFRRQVKPPEVLKGTEQSSSTDPSVRLRLLVSAEGRVIDSEILKGIPSLFERARKIIKIWSFQPARWGTLCVPWYLEVDVPIDHTPAQAGVTSPRGL